MPSLVRCPLACLFFLAVIAGPFSDTAGAAAYTFTNIADTDGIFAPTTQFVSGLGTAPLSISNTGTVAFSSLLKAGGNGVFAGNGGPVQSIALSSDPVFLGVGGASINSAGTVAFRGIFDAGGEGVFTGSGGPVTAIALSSEATFSSFGNPVISDAGTVGFQVNLVGGSRSILTRTGGSTTTIAA